MFNQKSIPLSSNFEKADLQNPSEASYWGRGRTMITVTTNCRHKSQIIAERLGPQMTDDMETSKAVALGEIALANAEKCPLQLHIKSIQQKESKPAMSNELAVATEEFNAAVPHRHFVLNPSNGSSITIRTSDPDMRVCSVAARVAGVLQEEGGHAAREFMIHLIEESEKKGHMLSLAQKSFKPAAATQLEVATEIKLSASKIAQARSNSDYAISLQEGGKQYADTIQAGHRMDLG